MAATHWWWLVVLCVIFWSAPTFATEPAPLDLRIRVAWGGGAARTWKGRLATNGALSKLTYLGVEADQTATTYLEQSSKATGQAVVIAQRNPVQYAGFDISVRAASDSALTFVLTPLGNEQESATFTVPLHSLINGDFQKSLDDQGNRLVIHRTGGDRIRVAFDRDSLVFSPGESFRFTIEPHELGIDESMLLKSVVTLTHARGGDQVAAQQRDIELAFPPTKPSVESFTFSVPDTEGVYELNIALYRPRFADTIMHRGPLVQRKIQFVVVGDSSPPVAAATWTPVESVDPNHVSWMEWMSHIPRLPLLPDFRQQPLGNGKARAWEHLGQKLVRLQAGGWQAYPLSIKQTGTPHILEVEYPDDIPQTLGISIVEPNSTGQVVPIELDSGVNVSARWGSSSPGMRTHRLFFWPRTKTPLVLLTNRRPKQPAAFGTIRVLAGPRELPPATQAMPKETSSPDTQHRLLAAYFDKPLFPEQFCATEGADLATGQSLDDWVTFYEGGRRLVQYLRNTGYNGAVISVACQGSTLYPSKYLPTNPQYDTGVFFTTGQDPVRKDVLELLFRLFDRAGLTLVPAVQFANPLPSLEQMRRTMPQSAVGIELVNAQQQPWAITHGTRRGMAPYYNPLDPRVQNVVRSALGEITKRYSSHSAFGGLALQLEPDAYVSLPGGFWGQDPVTRARFERAMGYQRNDKSGGASDGFRARDRQAAWLKWRAKTLAGFYKTLARDLQQSVSGKRLLLMTGNLFSADVAQRRLRPSLPNHIRVDQAMLQLGLDIAQYNDAPSIIMFRPDRIMGNAQPARHGADINLSHNADSDRYFANAKRPAALFFHEPLPLPLPAFDHVSPFGEDKTHVILVAHVTPSAVENRRRFAQRLATSDLQVIADGGWMLPLGQETALRGLLRTLAALPAEPFKTVTPQPSGLPTQPLVIRTLRKDDRTFVYAVNPSPWSVTAEIDIQSAGPCAVKPLGGRALPALETAGNQQSWTLDVPPYDVVAAVLLGKDVRIPTWRSTLDRQAFTRLRHEVNTMRSRTNSLTRTAPFHSLSNPGFEDEDDPLSGWIHGRGEGTTVAVDDKSPYRGKHALKMSSTGPVAWVRSAPFKPPTTGRISVIVRLKTDDPKHQPPLRLVVEGRRKDGSTYSKYADDVGAGNKRLTDHWSKQPFMLHIDDLPTRGLVDLRVGFDLLGKGRVWIDDVQVYDLWFLPNERDELTIMSAVATMALNKGRTTDCLRVLEGFWPRFLNTYVPTEPLRTAALPANPAPSGPAIPTPKPKPSMFEKMRRRLPKRILPFQLKY